TSWRSASSWSPSPSCTGRSTGCESRRSKRDSRRDSRPRLSGGSKSRNLRNAKRHPAQLDGVLVISEAKLRLIVHLRAVTIAQDEEDHPSAHFQRRESFRRRVPRLARRYSGKNAG